MPWLLLFVSLITSQYASPSSASAARECLEAWIKVVETDRGRTERVLDWLKRTPSAQSRVELQAKLKQVDALKAKMPWRELLALPSTDPRYEAIQNTLAAITEVNSSLSGTLSGATPQNAFKYAWRNKKRADEKILEWIRTKQPVTIERLRELNRIFCAGLPAKNGEPGKWRIVEEGPAGLIGSAAYMRSQDIPQAIAEFEKWYALNAKTMHPVELAARCHQWLVSIHPFGDGNGRTARQVMDWILQDNGYPPAELQMNQALVGLFADTPDTFVRPPEAITKSLINALNSSYRTLNQMLTH